jgi:hypothetical protein
MRFEEHGRFTPVSENGQKCDVTSCRTEFNSFCSTGTLAVAIMISESTWSIYEIYFPFSFRLVHDMLAIKPTGGVRLWIGSR